MLEEHQSSRRSVEPTEEDLADDANERWLNALHQDMDAMAAEEPIPTRL